MDAAYNIYYQFSIFSEVPLNSGAWRLETAILRLPCSYDSGYNLGPASKAHSREIWKVEKR